MADPSHIDYLHITEFIRSQLIWVHTVFKTGIKFGKSYFLWLIPLTLIIYILQNLSEAS